MLEGPVLRNRKEEERQQSSFVKLIASNHAGEVFNDSVIFHASTLRHERFLP